MQFLYHKHRQMNILSFRFVTITNILIRIRALCLPAIKQNNLQMEMNLKWKRNSTIGTSVLKVLTLHMSSKRRPIFVVGNNFMSRSAKLAKYLSTNTAHSLLPTSNHKTFASSVSSLQFFFLFLLHNFNWRRSDFAYLNLKHIQTLRDPLIDDANCNRQSSWSQRN